MITYRVTLHQTFIRALGVPTLVYVFATSANQINATTSPMKASLASAPSLAITEGSRHGIARDDI
jgi:hypothetical protein